SPAAIIKLRLPERNCPWPSPCLSPTNTATRFPASVLPLTMAEQEALTPTSIPASPATPEPQPSSIHSLHPPERSPSPPPSPESPPPPPSPKPRSSPGPCAQSERLGSLRVPAKKPQRKISPCQLTSPAFRGKLPSEPAFRRFTAGGRNKICSRNLCRGLSFALTSRILTWPA